MANDEKDSLPTIPWYWRDWLASDARASMTLEAQAIYRNLLDRCWGSDDCSIPNDDRSLAALAGATPKEWARAKPLVLARFQPAGEGRITNPRLRHEWETAKAYRAKKREGAIHTNARRWNRPTTPPGDNKSAVGPSLSVSLSDSPSDRSATRERPHERVDIESPASASASASASADLRLTPSESCPQERTAAAPDGSAPDADPDRARFGAEDSHHKADSAPRTWPPVAENGKSDPHHARVREGSQAIRAEPRLPTTGRASRQIGSASCRERG